MDNNRDTHWDTDWDTDWEARRRRLGRVAFISTLLTLVVVVLGAYVRLSDAGLGCPDWPGCYGKVIAPSEAMREAVAADYERPLEVAKAWKEMVHRYVAGLLGLLICYLAVSAWRSRASPERQLGLALTTAVLVVFQALLGMWTVTLQLKPLVVVLHLLGGFSILTLLWWQTLRYGRWWSEPSRVSAVKSGLRPWALGAVLILGVQIFLGGWTSSNYAALACPDFPTCHAQWWPQADFSEGFVLWRGLGTNYEGGVLEGAARVAIHLTHRVGAAVTFLYIAAFALGLLWSRALRASALALLAVLLLQVALGIANVLFGLPLVVAVLHNAVAALLLLTLVAIVHQLWPLESVESMASSG